MDGYDRPILDSLHRPDTATANRDCPRGLHGMMKGCAGRVRFTFVTGVSMFSGANLFSGANNLRDIGLDRRYATICGYTDIDTVFAPPPPPEPEGLDRGKIRAWYSGYGRRGGSAYNPFHVPLPFRRCEFHPYRYGTGPPSFLFDTLTEG